MATRHTLATIAQTQTLTNKTLTSPVLQGDVDGWVGANETWTYASATTITVPSGAASTYQKGDKIKLTQTTVKYFYITAVADTVLTVTGGTDYTVADAAISLNYYSKVENPQGFPAYFNYTPTWSSDGGAFTNDPTVTYARFKIEGGYCQVEAYATYNATSGGDGRTIMSLPITPSQIWTAGQGMNIPNNISTLVVGAYETGNSYFQKYDGATNIANSAPFGIGITYAF